MSAVDVVILHPPASPDAGALEGLLADARAGLATRQVRGFEAAGATTVRIVTDPFGDRPFGDRLRELARQGADGSVPAGASGERGLVLLGSGSLALATAADRRRFVEAAAGQGRRALTNNRFSSDAIALTAEAAATLAGVPPGLPGDNALPRWLAEVAAVEVSDLRSRWRLAVDLDSPLDVLLVAPRIRTDSTIGQARERMAELRSVMADRQAELVVAGRTSAGTLSWLERGVACRVRAIVEERGLRASSRQASPDGVTAAGPPGRPSRPPRSVLGMLLDRDGPGSLGTRLAELGDAAVVDSRVLLAHRLGVEESAWPPAEDRFASDLLLPGRVADPWLRALTASALAAPIPVLLGGHTLVGPGMRLLAGGRAP